MHEFLYTHKHSQIWIERVATANQRDAQFGFYVTMSPEFSFFTVDDKTPFAGQITKTNYNLLIYRISLKANLCITEINIRKFTKNDFFLNL